MRRPAPFSRAAALLAVIPLLLLCWLAGCLPLGRPAGGKERLRPRVQPLDISDAAGHAASQGPISVHGARNEWVSFTLEIADVARAPGSILRLRTLKGKTSGGQIAPARFETFQIVAMPVDVNRAGYVRHTGLNAAVSELPRALIPVPHRDGRINLDGLRPVDPRGTKAAPRLWVDLHIPPEAPAGDYAGAIELLPPKGKKPVASIPLNVTVYDFAIPEERDLQIVSRLSWDGLTRLFPDRFEGVTPRLLSRNIAQHRAAVRTLDDLTVLAQRHRLGVFVPRLQPTVKWPLRDSGVAEPVVDWDDYDQLVAPWMGGGAFADGVPAGFWLLPAPDFLQQFPRGPQLAYWAEAARHFEQNDWLDRSVVWLEGAGTGRARPADAAQLSLHAGQILRLHDKLRAALPLEDDQIHLTERNGPEMIDPATADRLWAAAPGLVFSPPTQFWPESAGVPRYWLRTDLPGLVPYDGAGSGEQDLRLWAWLAFLRKASLISFGEGLPTASGPEVPADPDETVWFYPGHWFGLEQPVPTVQLKWLRRAQQDYQYLHLARERGEVLNALVMARLMTKPVEVQPGQAPDPAYALMCGTADPDAWDAAHRLLARSILLRDRNHPADAAQQQALYLDTLRWVVPQERPLATGRTVRWLWEESGERKTLSVRVGIDIYNASDNRTDRNLLRWSKSAAGWQVDEEPIEIPALDTYNVRREYLDGTFDLEKVSPAAREPVGVAFTNGFTNRDSPLSLALPVATSERVEGRRIETDGRFDEWDAEDLIQDGPLVQMLSRPAVQRQELRRAATNARVYTGWAEDNFCFAFGVQGITPENLTKGSQNFVDYQFRRGWGEDLCAVLIQPVFADNTVGPTLHVVCKPTGLWVERKLDARRNANPWQPLEGTGVRYKAVVDGTDWRGEVAIPWRAICDPDRGVPPLLRFNFIQHRHATGESASWAGPVDFGRDDAFTGVLHIREARAPGMGHTVDAYNTSGRR